MSSGAAAALTGGNFWQGSSEWHDSEWTQSYLA